MNISESEESLGKERIFLHSVDTFCCICYHLINREAFANAYGGDTMKRELQIANRFFEMYREKYNEKIDEMKLHKLMYFAQRESLIVSDVALFDEEFRGWKYGPVLKSVREAYMDNSIIGIRELLSESDENLINFVFRKYAEKTSWSLSRLTHNEYSWLRSREGISDGENGDNPISIDDIRIDAKRIRARREKRKELGLV